MPQSLQALMGNGRKIKSFGDKTESLIPMNRLLDIGFRRAGEWQLVQGEINAHLTALANALMQKHSLCIRDK
jgi:hypothetical protein